jgi:hypothetical protein
MIFGVKRKLGLGRLFDGSTCTPCPRPTESVPHYAIDIKEWRESSIWFGATNEFHILQFSEPVMERACTGTEERLLEESNIQHFLDFIKRSYTVEVDLMVIGAEFPVSNTMIRIELLVAGEQDDFVDEVTLVFRNSRLMNVHVQSKHGRRGFRLNIPNEIYKKELIFNI